MPVLRLFKEPKAKKIICLVLLGIVIIAILTAFFAFYYIRTTRMIFSDKEEMIKTVSGSYTTYTTGYKAVLDKNDMIRRFDTESVPNRTITITEDSLTIFYHPGNQMYIDSPTGETFEMTLHIEAWKPAVGQIDAGIKFNVLKDGSIEDSTHNIYTPDR